MLVVKFASPSQVPVTKYLPTDTLKESEVIVNSLRSMSDDRIFRVEEATYISSNFECTPL